MRQVKRPVDSNEAIGRGFRIQSLRARRMQLEASLRILNQRRDRLKQDLEALERELSSLLGAKESGAPDGR